MEQKGEVGNTWLGGCGHYDGGGLLGSLCDVTPNERALDATEIILLCANVSSRFLRLTVGVPRRSAEAAITRELFLWRQTSVGTNPPRPSPLSSRRQTVFQRDRRLRSRKPLINSGTVGREVFSSIWQRGSVKCGE